MIMWRIRRAVRMALRRERRTLMNGIRKIMRRYKGKVSCWPDAEALFSVHYLGPSINDFNKIGQFFNLPP